MSRKRNIREISVNLVELTSLAAVSIYIQCVSHQKGRNSQFFDATLADTTSKVRIVGLAPISLYNWVLFINHAPLSNSPTMISTQIRLSPRKIDMATIMASSTVQSQPITITITSQSQYDKVSINIKVIRLFPTQASRSRTCSSQIVQDFQKSSYGSNISMPLQKEGPTTCTILTYESFSPKNIYQ